jgi:tetratricopeptide (TPR) repeat protein
VLARLALAVRYGREPRVAEVMSREACRMAEARGGAATQAEALRYRHEVLSGPRFAQERLEIARRMLPLARAIPSRPLELDALIFAVRDSFKLLDHVGAKEAAEAADALAATMRHPGAQFRSGMRVVFLEALRGRLDLAERHAHEFHERDRARNMGAAGTLELQLVMLATLREDHLSMVATLSRMAARYDLAWVDCGLARAHAGLGHRAHAERYLRAASADEYRRLEDHHSCLGGHLHLTETYAALGDRAGATELYRRMLPYERLMATPFLSIIWQGPVAYGLGTLAALLSDDERARRHFECALEIVEPLRSPPLIAQCRERLGQLLLRQERRRHRARALALLQGAAELAETPA